MFFFLFSQVKVYDTLFFAVSSAQRMKVKQRELLLFHFFSKLLSNINLLLLAFLWFLCLGGMGLRPITEFWI